MNGLWTIGDAGVLPAIAKEKESSRNHDDDNDCQLLSKDDYVIVPLRVSSRALNSRVSLCLPFILMFLLEKHCTVIM